MTQDGQGSPATPALLPWQVYVLIVVIAFTINFVCFKIGGMVVTAILFGFVANFVNFAGHVTNILRKMAFSRFRFSIPWHVFPLALLGGFIVSSNDVSGALMFKAGAPLSIATPVFSAGNVILTVLFGFIVLKETLSSAQRLGLLFAVAGIVLLNV